MFKLNKMAMLSLLIALGVAGCGKKKCKDTSKAKTKKVALSETTTNLLDDADLSEFAFVESDEAAQKMAANSDDSLDLDSADDSTSFKTVHFDFNKNNIRPDQKPLVAQDVTLAEQAVKQGKKVVIEGHCDQIGSATYNLALSERRAQSVKNELLASGKVTKGDIKTVGYGFEKPLVWSDAKTRPALIKELAPNRRAELVTN